MLCHSYGNVHVYLSQRGGHCFWWKQQWSREGRRTLPRAQTASICSSDLDYACIFLQKGSCIYVFISSVHKGQMASFREESNWLHFQDWRHLSSCAGISEVEVLQMARHIDCYLVLASCCNKKTLLFSLFINKLQQPVTWLILNPWKSHWEKQTIN